MSFLGEAVRGIFGAAGAKQDRKAAEKSLKKQHKWALQDREHNEALYRQETGRLERRADALTKGDRAYARQLTAQDRAYAARLTKSDRAYERGQTASDRAYERQERTSVRDEQRGYDRGALSRMREDAQAAGFNPLSVLGAGGVGAGSGGGMVNPVFAPSGFVPSGSGSSPFIGSTSGAAGMLPQAQEWQPVALPAASSMSFLGDALGAGVDTFFNREDKARADEAHALQVAIMGEELEALQRENANPYQRFGYSIPEVVSVGPTSSGVSEAVSSPDLVDQSMPDYRRGPMLIRPGWATSPGSVAAQVVESEYGEVAGEAHGLTRWVNDYFYNELTGPRAHKSPRARPSRVSRPSRPRETYPAQPPSVGGSRNFWSFN